MLAGKRQRHSLPHPCGVEAKETNGENSDHVIVELAARLLTPQRRCFDSLCAGAEGTVAEPQQRHRRTDNRPPYKRLHCPFLIGRTFFREPSWEYSANLVGF